MMAFIETNGVRLHYELEGDAGLPVLVLSNSLGTDLSMWDVQMPALIKYFRVLRYDTRGHGDSSVPPGPYTVERLGQDVIALLDGLGLGRVCFCGLSMSGTTGIWLGVHAPERLEKLALCNTAALIGTADVWNARMAAVREGGMAAVTEGAIVRWFRPATIAAQPAMVEKIRKMLLATSPEGYVANCAAVRDADQRASVARINVPTLVIAGSDDTSTPARDGLWLAGQIPDARFEELPAAHLSNIDAASQFTETLLQFMR